MNRRIYNLCSERAYDHACFLGRAVRFPFDDHNPPMLNMIPEFCAHMDSWLGAHPENVVSIHCKAGKGRTGCLIAAYLVHCGMFSDPEDALTFFGRRRTENEKGVTIASQMRFVHYYSHMLRHGPMPVLTLRILHVRILTVPDVELGSCTPSLEIRMNNARVFDFARAAGALRRYKRPGASIDLDLTPWDLRVRENIMFQFYHHR
jgi:phosphatidylinositol-3,4,5-trisphosphate 3-phosphatase/dual-specificity protein phosphatase PTEN